MSSLAASLVTGVGLRPERPILYQRTSFPSSRRNTHGVVKASARVDKFSKSDIIVSPSILSANFSKLGEQVKAVELAGCDWIHVDVMDGRFVPNITIGPLVVDALRPVTDLPLDVHLMIVEPEQRVPDFIKAGADIVSVHCEQSSTIHLHRTVNQIKSLGAKAGVVLNPGTPLSAIEYVLDSVDLVLIMSVNPGFGGQSFIESQVKKIADLRRMCVELGVNPWIEVDGGVTPKNAYKVKNLETVIEAGANALVAGSAVFGAKDYAEDSCREAWNNLGTMVTLTCKRGKECVQSTLCKNTISKDQNPKKSEIAFFDVETTVPKRGERFAILEFGSILVCPRKLTELRSYTTLVQPADLSLISTLSVRCNGISRNDVVLAPLFSDIADTVYDILHGRIWAGHNILRFDCARIREAFAEIGRQPPEPKGAIDSLALLTQRFGRRAGDMKMATLASYFGLGKQTHRSLDDVRMNLEVLKYCATVLFLESSLPDVLVDKSVSPTETTSLRRHLRASSSSGEDNTLITPFTLPSIGENSVAQPDPFNMNFLRNEMASDNNLPLDTLMEEEENQPSDTVVVSANTSDREGFLSPDAISLSNIRAVLVPFYHGSQLMRLKLLHGDSSPLQLYCSCLKIRFGISGKFLDNSGRRRLNFVVDLNPRLCSILEACDSNAQKVSVDSGSSSDWNTVVSPVKGLVNYPNARIHIPTEISGDAARYAIEVHQRESGGDTQKLIFSNPSAEELETLLKQGSVVDAFLSLEPYDYQQKAGVRLVAKKLVMHS
uniref:ribulose-phosphate 3-epimerase n=2 Tax=Brassica oleracea TaxID=3712 RepID=A0A0D3EH74_BRAOL|nr:unnamed protein product [Brassica oleracea]